MHASVRAKTVRCFHEKNIETFVDFAPGYGTLWEAGIFTRSREPPQNGYHIEVNTKYTQYNPKNYKHGNDIKLVHKYIKC